MQEKENLELKKLNYNSYLKVPELLSLQQELSNPKHHDEMFFIVIHQAMELWFKEILHETEFLVESLRENSVSRALKALKRNTAIFGVLQQQINLLSTLTPVEFAGFRDHLKPASGFQSIQYRELEFTYGLRDAFFLQFFAPETEMRKRLEKIQKEPSVYDIFLQNLAENKYPIPKSILRRDFTKNRELSPELSQVLKSIYENPGDNYHFVLLCEALLDFDEKFSLWRNTHILMVARTIGAKPGTGGSAGYKFLEGRLHYRFFPELWDLRTHIGEAY